MKVSNARQFRVLLVWTSRERADPRPARLSHACSRQRAVARGVIAPPPVSRRRRPSDRSGVFDGLAAIASMVATRSSALRRCRLRRPSVELFWNDRESFGSGGGVEATVPGGERQTVAGECEGGREV